LFLYSTNRWEIRESCNPIIREIGYNYKYDISLPLSDYYDIVEEMRERLVSKPEALVVNWGHVIDGNLHLNIITPGDFSADEQIIALIEPFIFESVVRRGGSISAEHGLGQSKNNYLGKYAKKDDIVKVMKLLKSIFDPNGIMNPGKFLPSTK
jgi:FAD/FMN-containing dehydrogenases